ncbi:MAG: ABC transporter ATP-binding protein [Lachnospiraceae bacterium]
MFKKKKQEAENALHTEYGILSNSIYILKKIKQYCPFLLLLMGIGIITNSMMEYLWSFIGKFVLDIVQVQASGPDKDITPLIKLLLVTTAVELISKILNTVTDNKRWYYFINVRMKMITERIAKVLSMNYQMLEQPDILDMHQKASQATGSNDNGVEGLMHSLYTLGVQLLLMIITVSAVTILDWRMLLILMLISFAQFLFFRYTVKKDKREVWDMLAPTWRKIDYMTRTTQDFDYAKDIRLFNMPGWLSGKQHEVLMEKQSKMLYSRNLWIYNSAFAHAMSMLSTATVYGVLIFTVIDKNMSIGNFTLFLGLSSTFTSTLTQFLNSLGDYKKRSLQVDDFRSFMDLKTEDDEDALPVPKADRYTFEFKNVSYKYEGAKEYALKNLNLTLEAGKKLAVVGLNGAGKTTFIKLLLRLYDVTEGEILCNGTDIRRFKREEYYRLFAPVFQNVELFAFPMSENVSMKRPADTDRALSEDCLKKAGLNDKVQSLPEGIDTQLLKVIYDDGIDLSGGEKQKLALARALYKHAPIIVLDEPTAALDALAEYRLYKSFDEIIGDKTAVYISHRLSSTRFCDSIAMFKAGEMVEYGTHEELLAKDGAYAEMFEIQAQYYKEGEVVYAE